MAYCLNTSFEISNVMQNAIVQVREKRMDSASLPLPLVDFQKVVSLKKEKFRFPIKAGKVRY